MEQPHLITVHHLDNNGVHLRDFKRWLTELRGRKMPESFAWSYKRKYKIGYIWQDLTEDDLIIPISDYEYVLKGSLLFSPIKIIAKSKEEDETRPLVAPTNVKTPHKTIQIEKNIYPKHAIEVNKELPVETSASTSSSSYERIQRKAMVFKIDSWREEMKRSAKQMRNEIVCKEDGIQFNGVIHKKSNHKWAWTPVVLRKFLGCRMVETTDSIMKVKNKQSDSRDSTNNNKDIKLKKYYC